MKTILALALVATFALAIPAVSAHTVIILNEDCLHPITIGDKCAPVHAWVGVTTCSYNHNDVPALPICDNLGFLP